MSRLKQQTIRLPEDLVAFYELIAKYNGITYSEALRETLQQRCDEIKKLSISLKIIHGKNN